MRERVGKAVRLTEKRKGKRDDAQVGAADTGQQEQGGGNKAESRQPELAASGT